MEERFFKGISDEQQEKNRDLIDKVTRAERDTKDSYARKLTERLAAMQREKVKP